MSADGLSIFIPAINGHGNIWDRKYSGKWYFEFVALTGHTNCGFGVMAADPTIAITALVTAAGMWGFVTNTGEVYHNGTAGGTGWSGAITNAVGDVFGCAADIDNGKIYWSKNGTWLGGSNPATSTSPAATDLTSARGFVPTFTGATTVTANGQMKMTSASQSYAAPSGYTAWGNVSRTLDPYNKHAHATLSNGNRTVADATGTKKSGAFSDEPICVRPVYFEAKFDVPGAADRYGIGISSPMKNADDVLAANDLIAFNNSGGAEGDRVYVTDQGKVYERNTLEFTGPSTFGSSDTMMFAYDPASGKVWVGKNGSWWNSGDPATGLNPVYTIATVPNKTYAAAVISNSAGTYTATVNFGSTTPTYDVPEGFTMLGVNYGSIAAAVAIAAPFSLIRKAYRTAASAVSIATAFARSLARLVSFNAAVTAATAFTNRRVLTATLPASVTVATAMNKRAILHALLTGEAVVLTDLDFEGGTYIGWVANADIGAHSMYTDFDFNSLAADGENYYGAKSDGLYLLGADTDDGTAIDARIRTGRDSMGSEQQKRIPVVYQGEGDLMLKVVMDERTSVYDLHIRNPQMAESRVKPGKGYKSVYWQFELVNRNGADFEEKDMTVFPIILQRRIK